MSPCGFTETLSNQHPIPDSAASWGSSPLLASDSSFPGKPNCHLDLLEGSSTWKLGKGPSRPWALAWRHAALISGLAALQSTGRSFPHSAARVCKGHTLFVQVGLLTQVPRNTQEGIYYALRCVRLRVSWPYLQDPRMLCPSRLRFLASPGLPEIVLKTFVP